MEIDMTHHERLSALDTAFLAIESGRTHMHVGAIAVFEPGPLRATDGRLDVAAIRDHVVAATAEVPRTRQRIARTPGFGQPVWVDHERFTASDHVPVHRLRPPGDGAALRRHAAAVFSRPLDRTRPLWELEIVDGLADGGFALIAKIHHCMIDGIAGADLLTRLLSGTSEPRPARAASASPIRRAPARLQLLASELRHRVAGLTAAAAAVRAAIADPRSAVARARSLAHGMAALLREGLTPASPTSLNPGQIGPRRSFQVLRLDLEEMKLVKRTLGGSINDVALAAVAGALRRTLARRGGDPARLTDVRAMVPVSTRAAGARGALGNDVALRLQRLPVDEPDPATRLRKVVETTRWLKDQSQQAASARAFEHLADGTTSSLVSGLLSIATRRRAFNLVVTNVPGPPFPLWLLGAPLRALYPLVPLFENQTVGVAMFSYRGAMFVGLSADADAVSDLDDLAADLATSTGELVAAARG
jgi:diacylglycerol O-acyltransferase / wax synthase